MIQHTITVAGAKGGSGTTTIAAALALYAARHATTELVACESGATATLLGLARRPATAQSMPVTEQLALVSTATGTAEITVHDAGRLDSLDRSPQRGFLIAVLRGPCYVGLHSLVTSEGPQPAGVVLLAEAERSLTSRDVADVCGIPVLAEIAASARVARTIDAGLLVTALRRLTEFTALRRYVDRILAARDHPAAACSVPTSATHPSLSNPALKISNAIERARSRPSARSTTRMSVLSHVSRPPREWGQLGVRGSTTTPTSSLSTISYGGPSVPVRCRSVPPRKTA